LILWVPPQFDPTAETLSADLFQSRLDEFVNRRPQTDIQVRIKSLEGEFGLLNSLELTESAAPILMPDLIALPRTLFEQAFSAGLVAPLDGYTETLADEDWFGYAHELAQIEGQIAGIPFGGDMMTLAYKNDSEEAPPTDWNEVIAGGKAMAFPASDPRSLVTLAAYQSLEGNLRDEEGNPLLESDPLLDILSYYQTAQAANVMPYWLTQFETAEQVWASYQERQSTLAITWSSLILNSESPNTSLSAVPTRDGVAFTFTDGWVWCVVISDAETEQIAVELAEFLTEPAYLNTWALEAGYLPVRPTGLENWSDTSHFSILNQLLPSAVLIPDTELQVELGPRIRDAVVSVLKDQVEPTAALDVLLENFQQ
jgi:ABC-type glycerol-3-phosphate transport system substrate-binding protein